ncbi:MAG: hypothetical protein HKN09_03985 [Saprospiraceae bacterium]|nr:hypothetical protein [Saprospiraceae bacterium]
MLNDLVYIYDDRLQCKENLFFLEQLNGNEKKLYSFALGQKSDRFSASKIYGKSPSHQTYQSLKKGLIDKLLSSILLTNRGYTIQRERSKIYRRVMAVQILDLFGMRPLMKTLGKKVLTKCLSHHMYYEAAGIARLLFMHLTIFEKNLERGEQYFDIANKSWEVYYKEMEIQMDYSKILYFFQGRNFTKLSKEYGMTAAKYASKLEYWNSSRIYSFYYLIKYSQAYAENDLLTCVDICKKAIDYFDNLGFNYDISKANFVFQLVNCYLELSEFAKADLIIKTFVEQTPDKSPQYYRFQELRFRINLYMGDIEKANSSFNYLKKNIRKMENTFTKDRLLIYELYLDILNNKKSNLRRLKYNMNKIQQDKKGTHIPFMLGVAIQNYMHDIDKFIDSYEALVQYSYRYLSGDEYERTRHFIKILGSLLDGNIDTNIQLGGEKQQLSRTSLEMIQYESLLTLLHATPHASSTV